jgi:hypothetical protein
VLHAKTPFDDVELERDVQENMNQPDRAARAAAENRDPVPRRRAERAVAGGGRQQLENLRRA